jgi:cell division protein FtsL
MKRRDYGWTAAVVLMVLASAVVVVKTKQANRTLVHELERIRAERTRLETEWAQLQLEEATLAHHGRVEQIARDQLGMAEPHQTVIVQPRAPPQTAAGAPAVADRKLR